MKWPGLYSNADPTDVPQGGAVVQSNCMSLVPGKLTPRRGFEYLGVGVSSADKALYRYRTLTGDYLVAQSAASVSGASVLAGNLSLSALPSDDRGCFSQTRKGWLIGINGHGRGWIYAANREKCYALGIDEPDAAPTVTAAGGGNAYAGTYYCAYRYVDADDVCSCLSELAEVTAVAGNKFSYSAPAAAETVARITKTEVYRSTVDQATTLYKVGEIAGNGGSLANDIYTDDQLLELDFLPILYDDGSLCARRQVPPPTDMALVCQFQDRWFYTGYTGTDDPERRNLILYSEPDEPESVPGSQNALVISDDTDDADEVTGWAPRGPVLVILKERHAYRFSFVSDPRFDGASRLICSRGAINNNCWGLYEDTLFALDQAGPWALTDEGVQSFSSQIRNYFRDAEIDWTKSDTFFVSVETHQAVVRFHVVLQGTYTTYPRTALCYSIENKSWWTETYNVDATCAAKYEHNGRLRTVLGTTGGPLMFDQGNGDNYQSGGAETGINWTYRSGMIPIPKAQVGQREHCLWIAFQPTTEATTFTVRIYYDHDATPASWYAHTEGPVTYAAGGTAVTVNMQRTANVLSDATGMARVPLKFRADQTVITRRWISVELSGTQLAEEQAIHSIEVE